MAAIYGSDDEPAAGHPAPVAAAGPGAAATPGAVPDLAALHREHFLHLTRLAAMLVGDRETAEDVVQDVFLRMQNRWRRLSDPAHAERYLRAAVVNGARTVLRRRRMASQPRRQPQAPVDEQPAERQALDLLRDHSVRAAVARLPARQKEVILLRYLEDLSVAETARVLGISGGAVKASTQRAMAALATILGDDGDD